MTLDDLLLALRVGVSLAAVLGVMWYLQRRLSRRAPRTRAKAPITVLGRQGVGAKAQIVIVEADGVRYVLGVTEHGITVLDRGDGATPTAASEPARTEAPASFEQILASTSQGFDETHVPRLRERRRHDPLRGSILSPQTWRDASEAIRRAR
ncbi:FliO/MopB family protein [Microbacterium sp. GXF7504]